LSEAADADRAEALSVCMVSHSRGVHVVNRARLLSQQGHVVCLVSDFHRDVSNVEQRVLAGRLPRPIEACLQPLDWLSVRAVGGRPSRIASFVARIAEFYRTIRQLRPDVVNVQYAAGSFAWLAATLTEVPVVVTVFGGDVLFDERRSLSARERRLTIQLLRGADLITVQSNHLRGVLDGVAGVGHKAVRNFWGIDLETFRRVDASSLRRDLGIPASDRVIYSPRLLKPFYNIHLIVEALPRILASHPDTTLLIGQYLADPTYARVVRDLGDRLGVADKIRFLDPVGDHARLSLVYGLSDVVVSVPPSDGLPLVLLESMACEVPCVLTRLQRYQEMVTDGDTALLVDPTAEAISAAVDRLLDDPELTRRIASRALEVVRREADSRRETKRLEEAFRSVRAAGRTPFTRVERAKILGTVILEYLRRGTGAALRGGEGGALA
jgi:glycosyltransferase involved in cell wall biosynthesis